MVRRAGTWQATGPGCMEGNQAKEKHLGLRRPGPGPGPCLHAVPYARECYTDSSRCTCVRSNKNISIGYIVVKTTFENS